MMKVDTKTPPKDAKPLPLDVQLGIVRYSPCGKVLAAGAFDAQVRRFDADTLTPLTPLTGHNGWVQALAFHPDAKRLFSADSWGALRCWPYADKDAKPLWAQDKAHDAWIRQVAVSPDGKRLATCSADKKVRLWSADDGKNQQEFAHPQDVFSLAFHPDGKHLLSGDLKGIVRQWELTSGKSVREFDASLLFLYDRIQDVGGVRCLAFDRAGTKLACGGAKPKTGGFVEAMPHVLVFDWASGKLVHTVKGTNDTEGFVHDLHWHADGFLMGVTSGQPGQGRLFLQRPEEEKPFFVTPKMANCHSLALHPNGTRFVVSATNANSSGNGRNLGKNKEYPGNYSPLVVWELSKSAT